MKKLLLFGLSFLFGGLLMAQNLAKFSTPSNWQNICINGDSIFFTADNDSSGFYTGKGITDLGNGKANYSPVKAGAGIDTVRYTVYDTLRFKEVSFGENHSCFITDRGKLYVAGNDISGRGVLGIEGDTSTHNRVIQVGSDTTWNILSTDYLSNLAIKSNGTLWGWGWNVGGQLGDGTTINRFSPVQIGKDANWIMVDAGRLFSLGLKSDGTIWTWGSNWNGQLGDGTTISRNTPQQVGKDSNWTSITAGLSHCHATKANGTLWAWGNNGNGVLGDGTSIPRKTPVQVGLDSTWKTVATGLGHTIAMKKNGTLWAWGRNDLGQLGDGTYVDKHTPVQIGKDSVWKLIAAMGEHNQAIKTDGTLWAWGGNGFAQLGDGTGRNRKTPVQIGKDSLWKFVFAGRYNSAAIKNDNSLWLWGDNLNGQFGDGTAFGRNRPKRLIVIDTFSTVKVIRISTPTDSSITQASCNFYTWQQNNITYTKSGIYTDTIMNVAGCDSVVTLNLDISNKALDTSIIKIHHSLFVWQPNATYQWLYCDSAMARIPKASTQSYVPKKDGYYACEITINDCIDTTRCIQWVVSGIEENSLLQIAIYPNPFKDNIQFDLGELQGETILKVLNTNGQLITTAKMQKNHFSMDTKDWPKGVYFIQLFNAKSSRTIKLIK